MKEEKKDIILVANYDNVSKHYISAPSRVQDLKVAEKDIKRQLLEVFLNKPEQIVAYKNLVLKQIMTVDEHYNVINTDKKDLFIYSDIIKGISEALKKEVEKC